MSDAKKKIFIVEDHPMVRERLAELVNPIVRRLGSPVVRPPPLQKAPGLGVLIADPLRHKPRIFPIPDEIELAAGDGTRLTDLRLQGVSESVEPDLRVKRARFQ